MNYVIGIPARMGSTRLPGKPLVKICGVPMIAHVYERVKMGIPDTDQLRIYIASPDKEIWDWCIKYRVPFVKVLDEPIPVRKPGERIYRMAKELHVDNNCMLITVQGDEPFVSPTMIRIITKQDDNACDLFHFMTKCIGGDKDNPSEVKVITNYMNEALYFTRLAIPGNRYIRPSTIYYKQVCIFSMYYLIADRFYNSHLYNMDAPDAIEMNAFLEEGFKVKMIYADYDTKSVDTKEDLAQARRMMKKDVLFPLYRDKYLKKG